MLRFPGEREIATGRLTLFWFPDTPEKCWSQPGRRLSRFVFLKLSLLPCEPSCDCAYAREPL